MTVLLDRLRSLGYRESARTRPRAGNLLPVAYDWRLSCRYNARRLGTIIEPALQRWRDQGGQYADAQVVFVCHSMGGLIARWYIEQCGGAEITRKLDHPRHPVPRRGPRPRPARQRRQQRARAVPAST